MAMYAIVSKSRKETVQIESPHCKTVDGKCTNGFFMKNFESYAIKTSRRLVLQRRIIVHDNAPAHTSKEADTVLENTGLTILQHSHYSLDLAPCAFFLFPRLTEIFMDRR